MNRLKNITFPHPSDAGGNKFLSLRERSPPSYSKILSFLIFPKFSDVWSPIVCEVKHSSHTNNDFSVHTPLNSINVQLKSIFKPPGTHQITELIFKRNYIKENFLVCQGEERLSATNSGISKLLLLDTLQRTKIPIGFYNLSQLIKITLLTV